MKDHCARSGSQLGFRLHAVSVVEIVRLKEVAIARDAHAGALRGFADCELPAESMDREPTFEDLNGKVSRRNNGRGSAAELRRQSKARAQIRVRRFGASGASEKCSAFSVGERTVVRCAASRSVRVFAHALRTAVGLRLCGVPVGTRDRRNSPDISYFREREHHHRRRPLSQDRLGHVHVAHRHGRIRVTRPRLDEEDVHSPGNTARSQAPMALSVVEVRPRDGLAGAGFPHAKSLARKALAAAARLADRVDDERAFLAAGDLVAGPGDVRAHLLGEPRTS